MTSRLIPSKKIPGLYHVYGLLPKKGEVFDPKCLRLEEDYKMKAKPEYVKEKTAELIRSAGHYSKDLEIMAEWIAELHWKLEDIQEMILSMRKDVSDKIQENR